MDNEQNNMDIEWKHWNLISLDIDEHLDMLRDEMIPDLGRYGRTQDASPVSPPYEQNINTRNTAEPGNDVIINIDDGIIPNRDMDNQHRHGHNKN